MKKILVLLSCMLLLVSPAYGAEESPKMTDMPKRNFSGERQMPSDGEFPQMPFGEGEMPQMPFGEGEMPFSGEAPQMPFGEGGFPGGQMPSDFRLGRSPGESTEQAPADAVSGDENKGNPVVTPDPQASPEATPPADFQTEGRGPFGGNFMPSGEGSEWQNRNPFGQNSMGQEPVTPQSFFQEYFTPILSLVLLGLAFLFVIFYRRKRY